MTMKGYPIFTRTLVVVIPMCVVVPLAGVAAGIVIAAAAVAVVGWLG